MQLRWLAFVLCSVLLTACGGGGGGGGASNQSPTAAFTASAFVPTPNAMRFNASTSSDPDGNIVDYAWQFGDGQSGSGEVVNHIYAVAGNYDVTLTVTDSGGALASVTQTVDSTATESISGTIAVAAGMLADSDTNNPDARLRSNDTPDRAQKISNPGVVGGYVNTINSGESGASFSTGDESDFFKVDLLAGQTVTLNIADPGGANLNLHLYHDDGSVNVFTPDYASEGSGRTESLTVPSSGSYFVRVFALFGHSNYHLVVGQQVTATDTLSLDHEFVPGEVIVRMKESAAAGRALSSAPSSLGLAAKAGRQGGPMLMSLGQTVQQRQTALRSLGVDPATSQRSLAGTVDTLRQQKLETLQAIKALRQRDDVLYAEPNYIQRPLAVPQDAEYDKQWHYRMINLPSAWDVTSGDSGVTVAVVDTGVLLGHPDLIGQFSADGGYDFILDDTSSNDDEPGIDANPDDPGDAADYGSSSFHGTHVAGTIAAATDFLGPGIGVAGVAPGVKIMPLRVLGSNGGTLYDINQALLYAAGLPNDSGTIPARTADVINLSLGGGGYSQMSQDVYNQVRAAGTIVVAAAGNEAGSTPSYPAGYDGVISVSAVDVDTEPAPYSNFGSYIDVAAPGGNTSRDFNGDGSPDGVLSTAGDDSSGGISYNYRLYQGTSMAAPHVAGVIALMKSLYSGLTPAQVDSLLAAGKLSRDLGQSGRDNLYGYGLIDAAKAVAAAQELAGNNSALPPSLTVIPEALNLGFSGTGGRLTLDNGGQGSLTISSASADVAWLTLTELAVDPVTKLGQYQITVDRNALAAGTYQATLTFVSSANTLTVPVILQVASSELPGNAGFQYVLLVDVATNQAVKALAGGFSNGILNYTFTDVPFYDDQRYVIISGSDMDNDLYICDAGESCGAYLALDMPVEIGVGDIRTGVDFSSGFEVPVAPQATAPTSGELKQQR